VSAPVTYEPGRQYIGRGAGARGGFVQPGPNDPPASSGIKAIDPETGKTVWDFKTNQGSLSNGVLATAGGVLFAATREGALVALDAKTGKYLWRFPSGVGMAASPMSYAIDGKQFVAVAAGGAIYSFALP
jgi:alcohol dehydrogenase (cytochrome c)